MSPLRDAQRLPAELLYADELAALAESDRAPRPAGWRLSPVSVRRFILGGASDADGPRCSRKIFGNDIAVERAIVTLAGQRGLMLVGEPGTAKSLLSELLAAAISGTSTQTVQGSAGTAEEQIRYSWNYALLLRDGPSERALVPGPLHRCMAQGQLLRFEEITRCPIEIQDSLIPVLSDRVLHVPELGDAAMLLSRPGFNIIATANLRDRGVNEMSAALKRRFNFETLQPIRELKAEAELVAREVDRLLADDAIDTRLPPDVSELLVTVFQELRSGEALGVRLEPLSSVLSTAEAVNVAYSAAAEAWYFGAATPSPDTLLRHMSGTVLKDDADDRRRLADYLRLVRSKRGKQHNWQQLLDGERWL
ncbi:MAG: AAA family ATPase [Xanthomonadales bacterium]|nr:AAA family ATPase [Xanthomonadales bacterium]